MTFDFFVVAIASRLNNFLASKHQLCRTLVFTVLRSPLFEFADCWFHFPSQEKRTALLFCCLSISFCQIPKCPQVLSGRSVSFFFIGKSLEDLFKQEVIEMKYRSCPLFFFSSLDPQNTCQSGRKGHLTNDTLVVNWGFDPRVTKGSHNATAPRNKSSPSDLARWP